MLRLRTRRSAIAVALISAISGGAVAAVAVLVAIIPWPVSFGFAVIAASAWCLWLERHPEADP